LDQEPRLAQPDLQVDLLFLFLSILRHATRLTAMRGHGEAVRPDRCGRPCVEHANWPVEWPGCSPYGGGCMIGRIAKLIAYTKAPKQTFVALHPWRAAKLGAAFWVGKKLFGGRSR